MRHPTQRQGHDVGVVDLSNEQKKETEKVEKTKDPNLFRIRIEILPQLSVFVDSVNDEEVLRTVRAVDRTRRRAIGNRCSSHPHHDSRRGISIRTTREVMPSSLSSALPRGIEFRGPQAVKT